MTQYEVKNLLDFTISRDQTDLFSLTVAQYQDEYGKQRQAIVFPENSGDKALVLNTNELRFKVWNQAAQAVREHVEENAIFFTWWDNAQRLHLMTGRNGWAFAPIAEAFPDQDEQSLWRQIGGTFDQDSKRLKQLAEYLMMDATEGLEQVLKRLSGDQKAYFFISLDDLTRLQELSALINRPIPLESRVFRTRDNIHTLIAQVKNWSHEGGTGNYLVQPIPGIGIRAWRTKNQKAENLLLVRLLPFTHSLEHPLDNTSLVFRSDWGGYLSIIEIDQ